MRGGWAQWGVGEEGGRKFGMLGVMRKVVKMCLGELWVSDHFLLIGCQASKRGHRKTVSNLSN